MLGTMPDLASAELNYNVCICDVVPFHAPRFSHAIITAGKYEMKTELLILL
jgi:hypothetical protein